VPSAAERLGLSQGQPRRCAAQALDTRGAGVLVIAGGSDGEKTMTMSDVFWVVVVVVGILVVLWMRPWRRPRGPIPYI